MRILVLGVYYASNLGDAVICDCVADRLMRAFPGAQIDLKDVKNRHAFRFPAGADIKRLGRSGNGRHCGIL